MAYSAKGPWNKSIKFIFPIKYVTPQSLKVGRWLSQMVVTQQKEHLKQFRQNVGIPGCPNSGFSGEFRVTSMFRSQRFTTETVCFFHIFFQVPKMKC